MEEKDKIREKKLFFLTKRQQANVPAKSVALRFLSLLPQCGASKADLLFRAALLV